jgi:hypothetical protein
MRPTENKWINRNVSLHVKYKHRTINTKGTQSRVSGARKLGKYLALLAGHQGRLSTKAAAGWRRAGLQRPTVRPTS